mgnify:CR=1 FL=1
MTTAFGSFTSQVLTAGDLNTAGGSWTTFTPSFTNFTLGNGTIDRAAYGAVFDFALSEADLATIAKLDTGRRLGPDPAAFG